MAQLSVVGESRESAIRRAALEWLDFRTNGGEDTITRNELENDFYFEGEKRRLIAHMQGIWKPGDFSAALTFVTTHAAPGKRSYDDGVGTDGLSRYKWRGDNPMHAENVGMRKAMQDRLPLIYLEGIAPGVYVVTSPVYLIAEEPEQQQFVFSATENAKGMEPPFSAGELVSMSFAEKRYAERLTRQRLHQPAFRAGVLEAYTSKCAVCSLGDSDRSYPYLNRLIDAAHIVPDSDARGVAAVSNGMAMCKIHHAAFDANILGIRPDTLTVEIRMDLLEVKDGPMLRHGLQERHGEKLLVVPRKAWQKPDPASLEVAYERFRAEPAAG